MSKGTVSLVALLGIFSFLFVSIFSAIVVTFGVKPSEATELGYAEAFWMSLMRTLDPGTMGDDSGWTFRIAMLLVTFFGIIVLSTFIGLVSNGIMIKLEDLRKGRSMVMERDHVIILGWSSKIFTIISELIHANENQAKSVIVVLAERDKVEMEDTIRERVRIFKNTKVICRTGNPIDIADINLANPNKSKSIIIMDRESKESDSQVIKSILALTANPKRRKAPYHIIAEIEEEKNYDVAKLVGKDEVELVLSDDFIARIIVQTSRQSGLSVVYTDLLDFEGDEIYFNEEPSLIGKNFRDVLLSYEDSAIIGVFLKDGEIKLPPRSDYVINEGDQIIGITRDDDTLIAGPSKEDQIVTRQIKEKSATMQLPEKILILGWNHRARLILRELDKYLVKKSGVDVVADVEEPEDIKIINKENSNTKITFRKADTTDKFILQSLHIEEYNHLLILSYQELLDTQDADAKTLITLLHMRNIVAEAGVNNKLNIVTEMLDPQNRELAKVTNADDFIISDNILGLLMSQVAENKHLMRIFQRLFKAKGHEVYLKPITDYILVDEPANFYTVVEAALNKNEIALGYRLLKNAYEEKQNYGIVLNPVKSAEVKFEEIDKVIVLAEA